LETKFRPNRSIFVFWWPFWIQNGRHSKPTLSPYGAACLTSCKYPFPLKCFNGLLCLHPNTIKPSYYYYYYYYSSSSRCDFVRPNSRRPMIRSLLNFTGRWISISRGAFQVLELCSLKSETIDNLTTNDGYKGSNNGKRARRKNLRQPRERFLISNEAPPSWIVILSRECHIIYLSDS
jgi:hypothetical protein